MPESPAISAIPCVWFQKQDNLCDIVSYRQGWGQGSGERREEIQNQMLTNLKHPLEAPLHHL